MINRFINYILHTISWNFIFRFISRMNFRLITSNLRAQILTMTIIQSLLFLRDLILNRASNNYFIRIITATPALRDINPNELINTNPKKIFWVGFVSTLIIYRQYILIKKFVLWPFKLGIYAFIYAVSGIDLSWFLSWFDIFKINIPQWVYVQYLNLYCNWLEWWKGTVQINNLKPETIPHIPKVKDNPDLVEVESNKFINKKNIIIGVTVIALIGIGIWYFFYSSNGNSGNGGGAVNPPNTNGGNIFYPNPPAPNTNDVPHTITISDNQTIPAEPGTTYDPSSSNLIDRLDATEAWGESNSDPWGSSEASSSISSVSNRSPSPTGSTDSTETVTPSSIKADLDHYFPNQD